MEADVTDRILDELQKLRSDFAYLKASLGKPVKHLGLREVAEFADLDYTTLRRTKRYLLPNFGVPDKGGRYPKWRLTTVEKWYAEMSVDARERQWIRLPPAEKTLIVLQIKGVASGN